MSGRWYVSFHGGEARHDWNNLHAFSAAGDHLGKLLAADDLPDGSRLREVRGFAFGPDGDLYVANAWQDRSQILRFGGQADATGRHPCRAVFVERHKSNPGLAHPFHVAFGPDGHLYVPSQDTNLVGGYRGPLAANGHPGDPLPHPPALDGWPEGTFHPGTFVPSADRVPGGLEAVRHVLFISGRLFVADRTGAIKVFDAATGAPLQTFAGPWLATPVHLLAWASRQVLLIGDRDRASVIALDPSTGEAAPLVRPGAGGLRTPAGLAWGPDGLLYVADRTGRAVRRYDPETGRVAGPPLVERLPDEPEFLLWVPA